jgi:hypothetical protein
MLNNKTVLYFLIQKDLYQDDIYKHISKVRGIFYHDDRMFENLKE